MENSQNNGRPFLVSVARDFNMYDKCVGTNPNLDGFRKIVFHNDVQNLSITERYNWFIDKFLPGEDCWVVFCHEDWRADEDLAAVLRGLDPWKIYGPIGVFLQHRHYRDVYYHVGRIRMCRKDGSDLICLGQNSMARGRVDTLDCQCVIAHSSLIRGYGLRFDENLRYDMYVEDFCASAHEKYGLITEVCPIRCTHFSYGVLGESFYNSLAYIRDKFKNSRKGYLSVVGDKSWFGHRNHWVIHRTHFPRITSRINVLIDRRNR